MIRTNKLVAGVVALTMALSLVGGVSASAQGMSLADLVNLFIGLGIISADKADAARTAAGITGTTPAGTTSGYNFTKDLTVGSKGADVTALQNVLGISPATGYFGSVTKAAVIKFQLAKGLTPAAGYVGAKTRAVLNAGSTTTGGTSVVVPTGTDLKVSLAATSPAASAIVAGQAAANLVEYTFTNTSATPAVVTNVTLARGGVSADTSLSSVYLYEGAVRLTDAATVSSGKITFNSAAGLFTVPAGASKTISVKSDILSSANGQLVVISLTGVTVNGPAVSAVYPISGAAMNIFSSSDIASATSTLTVGLGSSIQAGSLNQTIWSTSLSLSGRAVYLKSLAVKVIGSIPTDALQNVKLYVAGIQVGSAVGMDSNGMVTFDLSSAPYKIDSSRTIEVRADVIKGSSRTFSVSLQNASDMQIIDSNYNVGIAVATPATQSTGTFTVSTGSVTVSLDSTLSSGDVVTGASNVPLARYTMKAYGEDMKISYLNASSTDQLDNVALYANGVQIGSTQTISATNTDKLYSLGSSLIIPAGQTVTVEIRGDIKYNGVNATTSSSNTVRVGLTGYTNNAQGSYSSQLSTVPSSTLNGPTMTVKGAGLTVAKNASYANQTAVPNTSNVKIGSYTLQANSAEPVRITSLTVTLGGAAGVTTNVSNLRVSENATPVSPQASNNFSVDFTIPANGTKTIDIFADLGSVANVATTTLALNGYGVNSNITISQSAVTGQTITVGTGSLATPSVQSGAGYATAQFVVGNSTQSIASYNFVATNGAAVVTELTFAASGTSVTAGESAITSISVDGKSADNVDGTFTITGLSKNIGVVAGGVDVPVTVTYASVGTTTGGITSNNTAGLVLTGMKYTSGNSQVSTTTISVPTVKMTVVGSKPTVSLVNPTDTIVTTGGTIPVARVTVSADAKGAIRLETLPLSMQAVVSGSSAEGALAIKAIVGSTETVLVSGVDFNETVGAIGTTTAATGTVTFVGGYNIPAGTSVTFEITDNVTLVTDGSLRTSLGSSSLFKWKDVVGGLSGITGSQIVNYPTGRATVSY
jgi:hypothetical protein